MLQRILEDCFCLIKNFVVTCRHDLYMNQRRIYNLCAIQDRALCVRIIDGLQQIM